MISPIPRPGSLIDRWNLLAGDLRFRAILWVSAGAAWGWIIWTAGVLPDEERFQLGPMLRGLPQALIRPDTILSLVILLGIASLARMATGKTRTRALPLAPLGPVLALLPFLLAIHGALGPGNLRNLLRVYAIAAGGSLSLALAAEPALAEARASRRAVIIAVLLPAAGYASLWSLWTLHRHAVFASAAWDLGYIESALWNTTRGRLFQSTIESVPCRNILGDHFIPIQILVLPFYILGGRSPGTLLVLQSLWLAGGAVPLYLIARSRWDDPVAAVFLSGAYLLQPALHIINVFDFHSVALSIPLLFWAFYYLEKEAWFNFGLFLFLACLCKEEIPLIGVFWGVYIMVSRRRWIPGILTSLGCALLFWFALRVWLPAFSGREEFWPIVRYADLGGTVGDALCTVLTRPIHVLGVAFQGPKLEFLARLLAPLLFLPLFSPRAWIFALPATGVAILSSVPDMYSMADHHVTSPFTAFVLAAVLGLHTLSGILKRWVPPASVLRVGALAAVCCAFRIAAIQWQSSVYGRLEPLKQPFDAHAAAGHRMVSMIPPEASAEAPNHLVPHLSHRDVVWVFPEGRLRADWVLLDLSDHEGRGRKTYPLTASDFEREIRSVLDSGIYGMEAFENGFLLLRKGGPSRDFGTALELLAAEKQ